MVRKMSPLHALDILQFTPNAASIPLSKAIKTAVGNAKNTENLFFKSVEINEGMKMKRYRVGTAGRGRGRPYKRRFSHIKVVLTDEIPVGKIKSGKVKVKSEGKQEKETKKGESGSAN